MTFRLSTLSNFEENGIDYKTGDLSLYPQLIDDPKSLYEATNNAETKLKQSLNYNGKNIVVEDTSMFPSSGILRIGEKGKDSNFELIYYDNKNSSTFFNLVRGFAGSKRENWPLGAYISNSVMAEHHNSLKDALLKLESYIGTSKNPDLDSLNGILKNLENKYLAPRPAFKAFPLKGIPPLTVRFQNFSNSESIRFLWDFGDGSISSEKNPTHTYLSEGLYNVKLNMIMSTGAQGIATKKDYIKVSNQEVIPFFYTKKISESPSTHEATYEFIDQTDGDIKTRYWVFGDGISISKENQYEHTIRHTYNKEGTYFPSLLIIFKDERLKRIFLKEAIIVE
jgi:PKD repeat protein